MGLAEQLEATLARGRARTEARMKSTCVIRRDAGLGEQDLATGVQPRAWMQVYSGPCRLGGAHSGASASRSLTTPGGAIDAPVRYLSLPWATSGLAAGDLVEMTGGDEPGLVLQVVEASGADQQTALRLPVIGAQRPGEWDEEES